MFFPKTIEDTLHLIELIAAPFTFLALIFAWKQFGDARHHTQELSKIENALSTRFIGKFPEYLEKITGLVERAQKSISILCDYPAYSSFTDHRQYERYRNALRDQLIAEPRLEIRMICLDQAQRAKINREQFSDAIADWEGWKKRNHEALEKLQRAHKLAVPTEQLTVQQMFDIFESDDKRIIDDFGGVGVCEVSCDFSIHFWIADGHEAIFAIPLVGGDALEYGFSTSDNKLITAFNQLADRYAKSVKDQTQVSNAARV
jgi:hypothetical protein